MKQLPSLDKHYINGQWVSSQSTATFDVVSPVTAQVVDQLSLGGSADVDSAVDAAKNAFPLFAATTQAQRVAMFDRLIDAYEDSLEDMAHAITTEMGAPITVSQQKQTMVGLGLLKSMRQTLMDFSTTEKIGDVLVQKLPIGVAGMITPWNWPMNQVVCKVSAALAAGCSMVLKPSEYAPYSAALFADIVDRAELPPGVFNLVHGGAQAGEALASHRDVDVISITGSVRAGVAVAQAAAPTVKRVTQELGGKSPFIVLPDADLSAAANSCVARLMLNTGQSCNAPTRLIVPEQHKAETLAAIKTAISNYQVGDPFEQSTDIGPVVNKLQFDRVNAYIQTGIDEGAEVLCGGVSDHDANDGFFVKPTCFYDVDESMTVAQEEIFGPVLVVLSYSDIEHAIQIANASHFGLSAYVYGHNNDDTMHVATKLEAGMVHVNDAIATMDAPFGGFKQSGNGRERGVFGLEEYLEVKSIYVG
ncbi:aldehyde dehydrogenase [Arenicella chitinivorans]|uniref:Aldehyde dehydrogenase n=1 Tax=Arenicella chitinivorans TaxID=1329800 RepID=A0A918RK00_9GAMM|nr:aldehyde dehydrogenase family protein [Arenicella chitinivorans]GGZ97869.1 aldehyde dehydrogenase [Arenicella chitinivorans]